MKTLSDRTETTLVTQFLDKFSKLDRPKVDFEKVKKVLEDHKIVFALAEVTMVPQNYVSLEGKDAEQMLKLIEALEDHDDVQKVHANFDIPDEVIQKVG